MNFAYSFEAIMDILISKMTKNLIVLFHEFITIFKRGNPKMFIISLHI